MSRCRSALLQFVSWHCTCTITKIGCNNWRKDHDNCTVILKRSSTEFQIRPLFCNGNLYFGRHVFQNFKMFWEIFAATARWIFDCESGKWPHLSSVSFLLLKSQIEWLVREICILRLGGSLTKSAPHIRKSVEDGRGPISTLFKRDFHGFWWIFWELYLGDAGEFTNV